VIACYYFILIIEGKPFLYVNQYYYYYILFCVWMLNLYAYRGCRDRMVVGFTTTNAISTYMYLPWNCEFESRSWRGVLDTTLCDKVCQWLAADLWFSQSTPVSSTNQTDCHNIAEIFLKEALNTITLNPKSNPKMVIMMF
jgi:uncharacterized membrane protein